MRILIYEIMVEKNPNKIAFRGVGLLFIVIGIIIFSIGTAGWIINFWYESSMITVPSHKIMGGSIIMALGYLILELELLRKA